MFRMAHQRPNRFRHRPSRPNRGAAAGGVGTTRRTAPPPADGCRCASRSHDNGRGPAAGPAGASRRSGRALDSPATQLMLTASGGDCPVAPRLAGEDEAVPWRRRRRCREKSKRFDGARCPLERQLRGSIRRRFARGSAGRKASPTRFSGIQPSRPSLTLLRRPPSKVALLFFTSLSECKRGGVRG